MPCLTPYRGDTSQMLLFKIASCLEAGGGGGGSVTAAQIIAALGCTPACEGDVVNSFNGQVGDVVLTLADVSAVADGRYVLKTGDTMTGALVHPDGTAALPSITFTGDTDTGIYRIGANSFGLSAGGALIFDVAADGVNLTTALAYQYNSVNVIRAQTALNNYYFGPSGNLTGTGTDNVAVGLQALLSTTTGGSNFALGTNALISNTTGDSNVALGVNALSNNSTGRRNVAIGSQALLDLTTPVIGQNVAIGHNTGRGLTTGINNTILGANVTGLAAALSNNIIIADGAGNQRINVDSSGNTTLAGTVQTSAGTAALPAFSFTADPNTGLYNIGADSIGTSTGGTLRITTNTTDLLLATAFRLAMASGANTRAGNAVLVGGTVTVANTSVTANTIVLLTRKTSGGTIGFAVTYTVIAATSFTLTSDNVLDTSTYSYVLIENP